MTDDTRDRLITLEVRFEHISAELSDTHKKVEEMHALLLQARGARWIVLASAGLAGALASFVASIGSKLH
jgi:phosphoribosylcarboxyaminoimidazole (NCAIR) mutase